MDKVPHYSREYIERRTEALLTHYMPETLGRAQPTPLGDLAAFIHGDFGATFTFDRALGKNSKGHPIIGACYFEPTFAIFVDPSLGGDSQRSRFRFTLAHELGHLSLHRKLRLDFQSLDATAKAILDGQSDLEPGPRVLQTPRDFLEWQANAYAAGLLMPRITFIPELKRQQIDMGISRSSGLIYISDERSSQADYREVVDRLCLIYQTSLTATRIRLRELGLIRDARAKDAFVAGVEDQVSVQQAMSAALEELLKQWELPTEE